MAIDKSILESMIQQKTVLLSDGTKVRVRAFVMKEFKLLMLANDSGSSIEDTLIQVMSNCILDKDIDVDALPIFDLEVLYLEIYKLSKGSSLIPITFQCRNEITDPETNEVSDCGEEIKVMVNLNTVTVDKPMSGAIVANPMLTINMRYPNVLESKYFSPENENDVFDLIMRCIDSVNLNNDLLKVGTDIQYDEVVQVLDYIDTETFTKMANFIQHLPRIKCSFPIKCPKCGYTEPVTLVGLDDFFD